MIRDRARLAGRLRTLRQKGAAAQKPLASLAASIAASCQEADGRRDGMPPLHFPAELPVVGKRAEIVQAIAENQVLILCGETGSGKSTQLPKLCLEAGRGVHGLIGHTQPRRIAARSVAQRIASELQSELGQWVGYQVRFHHKTNPHNFIKLMTDGILLAEIQQDRLLRQYDTLIIDEAHERSINIDFLLGYLRGLLRQRPDLKLIVTSATLEPERLSQHFDQAPIIEVSGRLYPVEIRYRPVEDRDINPALLDATEELNRHGPGDTLVFLSGERAIREAARFLSRHHPPHTEIVPLFARQSQREQNRIFSPHTGQRIILATNVAETSLTVPNIRYVIDTGLARISRYSARSKIQHLPIEKISQASANQRKGRCGRVSAGVCIRLYDEEDFKQRPLFTEPEIRRTNLASVILRMQALNLGNIESFPFVDAPQPRQIKDGYQLLEEIGAMKNGRNTKLAMQLIKLPVDPRLARFVLAAHRYHCLEEALIIASALSIQDPRERPAHKQVQADAAHEVFSNRDSDFLGLVELWRAYQHQRQHLSKNKLRKWCQATFLAYSRMEEWRDLHQQLTESAIQLGLSKNKEAADYAAVHIALLSGFVTHVGMLDEDGQYRGVRNRRFRIFPGSALAKRTPTWIMAASLIETSQVFAHMVAKIKPQWLEQVAPHLLKFEYSEPHWDDKKQSIGAFEHVSLFGLPVNQGRRVNYGRIDPEHARELFIREGLVHGRLRTEAPFRRHNQQVIEQIRALEAKARRPDILVDEAELYRYFDEQLPAGIYSGAFFDKWYRDARKADPDILKLDKQRLMRHEASDTSAQRFPEKIMLGDNPVRLSYQFDPGSEFDGVTALIPHALLAQLDPRPFEWLVPGLLEEKIIQLIKSLPKPYRRHVVPAPDYAKACVEALEWQRGALLPQLSQRLQAMTGIEFSTDVWDTGSLPEHLRMKFAVIDADGNILARDHELTRLQSRLQQQGGASAAGTWDIEREHISQWDFGELPDTVHRQEHGLRLQAYPALVAEGRDVAIRVFYDRHEAERAMSLGLARLFQVQLKTQCKFLRKNMPHLKQSCLLYSRIDDCESLIQDMLDAIFVQCFHTGNGNIRSQQRFLEQLNRHKTELVNKANALAELVFEVLQSRQRISSTMAQKTYPASMRNDINSQLQRLVYPHFVWQTPQTHLAHYPRYLQAIEKRLEKYRRDPQRDARSQALIEPYWQHLREPPPAREEAGRCDSGQERFRWLLEEWRVSLFAQELKTAVPVSQKRIEEAFRNLG